VGWAGDGWAEGEGVDCLKTETAVCKPRLPEEQGESVSG